MSDAKKATISRFTNLLDGSILPRVSVYEILDYYEALKSNAPAPITIRNNCNITRNFLEDQIQEYENEEQEDYG